MAGAYVGPLLDAMEAINREFEESAMRREKAREAMTKIAYMAREMGAPFEAMELFEGLLNG